MANKLIAEIKWGKKVHIIQKKTEKKKIMRNIKDKEK